MGHRISTAMPSAAKHGTREHLVVKTTNAPQVSGCNATTGTMHTSIVVRAWACVSFRRVEKFGFPFRTLGGYVGHVL